MTKKPPGMAFVKVVLDAKLKRQFALVCAFYGISEAAAIRITVAEWIAEWDSRHGKKKQQSGDDGLEHKGD
jgi:hypothetical protein